MFFRRFGRDTVTRNWIILSTANIGAQFFAMLAAIRIARLLHPSGYGQLNIVQTAASIAVVIGGLGLRQVIIRECARSPQQSGTIFRKAVILQLTAAIPVCGGLLLYFRFGVEILPSVLTLLTIGLFGGLLFWELIESVALGHEKVHYTAILMLLGNSLWAIFAWSWPPHRMTPTAACTALVLVQLIKCSAYFGFAVRKKFIHKAADQMPAVNIAQNSLPFYWLALLSMATYNAPVLFLASRSSIHEVGIYSAGLKLTNPVHIIILALMASLLPSLSRLAIENRDRFEASIYEYLAKGTVLCIGISFCISIFRDEIVLVLFGQGYRASQAVLFTLIWFSAFWFILSLIGTTLAAANRHSLLVRLSTAHAIISIPILWVCAHYGAAALATAMWATAVVSTIYHWYFFYKDLAYKLPLSMPLVLFTAVLSFMALSWMISSYLSLMLRMAFFTVFGVGIFLWAWRYRFGFKADMAA